MSEADIFQLPVENNPTRSSRSCSQCMCESGSNHSVTWCVCVWACEWAGIVPGWWGLRGGCRCEERFYWASDSESQTWKIKTQNWLKSSKTGGELKDTWHHQYASFTMNKISSLCSFILKITHTLISAFFKSKNNKSVSSFSHVKVCSFSFIPWTSFRFELLK